MYKLPSLPGAARGYAPSDQPLSPPSTPNRNPAYGGGGLAATEGAEFIYVGSPVASQPTSQLASLFGNASVYVYSVWLRFCPDLAAVLCWYCRSIKFRLAWLMGATAWAAGEGLLWPW